MEQPTNHPSFEDPFRPPALPVAVMCLHCGREYESSQLVWQEVAAADRQGCWCCPTSGCTGSGFGFDVLPSDPAYYEDIDAWYALADDSAGERAEEMWDDDAYDEELWQEAALLSEATQPTEANPSVVVSEAPLPWDGAGRDAPPESGFRLRVFVPEDE